MVRASLCVGLEDRTTIQEMYSSNEEAQREAERIIKEWSVYEAKASAGALKKIIKIADCKYIRADLIEAVDMYSGEEKSENYPGIAPTVYVRGAGHIYARFDSVEKAQEAAERIYKEWAEYEPKACATAIHKGLVEKAQEAPMRPYKEWDEYEAKAWEKACATAIHKGSIDKST